MFKCFCISQWHIKCCDDIQWNLTDFSCPIVIPRASFKQRWDKSIIVVWTNNAKIEMSSNEFFFGRWACKSNRDSEKITTAVVLEYLLHQWLEPNGMCYRCFCLLYQKDYYLNLILICAERCKLIQLRSDLSLQEDKSLILDQDVFSSNEFPYENVQNTD